jgi:hypothetical protein
VHTPPEVSEWTRDRQIQCAACLACNSEITVRVEAVWNILLHQLAVYSHSHKQAGRNKHGGLHEIGRCTSDEPKTQAPMGTGLGKLCDAGERGRMGSRVR